MTGAARSTATLEKSSAAPLRRRQPRQCEDYVTEVRVDNLSRWYGSLSERARQSFQHRQQTVKRSNLPPLTSLPQSERSKLLRFADCMFGVARSEHPLSPRCSSDWQDATSDSTAESGSLVHQLASSRVSAGVRRNEMRGYMQRGRTRGGTLKEKKGLVGFFLSRFCLKRWGGAGRAVWRRRNKVRLNFLLSRQGRFHRAHS